MRLRLNASLAAVVLGILTLQVFEISEALADPQTFSGMASWYGDKFNGRKTASGEIFDMNKCSAAHRKLHLVTKVLVENPRNGKSTVVRVNDRGPFHSGRVMDLSKAAAKKTGIIDHGLGYIECTVLGIDSPLR
ncbi:MAG: septal ring lytic transglycosylase RlpA family protein [Candidatus Obscuribacterales bacterium]|nr:septal ring lytic transglycosylase RlpA family protein [Candidatus Obscuribacterales bacterium]